MRRRLFTAVTAAALLAGPMLSVPPLQAVAVTHPPQAVAAPPPLCGRASVLRIKHIVVLMDENKSFDAIIGPPGSSVRAAAPYLNDLADQCGLATDFHAITHPSHSDYIAATAGDTYVPPGCKSWTCVSAPINKQSIFGQIGRTAGLTWRTYAESMTGRCQTSSQDPYSPGHNPPVWFTPIAGDCRRWDVPISQLTTDLNNDALPSYSWIVPNKCNDMHNCSGANPITAGDTFIKTWMTRIAATASYRNGSTVVFITWDEGVEGGRPFNEDCLAPANLNDESCHIPMIVASKHVTPGTRSGTFFTLYSLLKSSEALLGLPYLGHAGDTSTRGMLAAFNLR